MNNNKQSSVEWLLYEIALRLEGCENSSIPHYKLMELGKQAKAMHKEEVEEAFANGVDDEYEYHINNEPRKNTEQYYNETFGGNND